MRALLFLAVAGCARPLQQWCEAQPDVESCLQMQVRDEDGELRSPLVGCGATDRWTVSGGYAGEDYFFSHETGDLVAIRVWTDTDIEGQWYGRVVSCRAACSYAEHENLTLCEGDPP